MYQFFRKNISVIVINILAFIPILIWFLMLPVSARFSSSENIFRSLGQLTGLVGMVLLSINFILAGKFKFLNEYFNGLNRVYIKHHIIGALAFCLILFHPIFLIIRFLISSVGSAFNFVFSFGSFALFFGKLGLLIFILLMAFTFYFSFRYQTWKNTHKYLGLVLFLGGIHMLFIPSDISRSLFLEIYMSAVALCGAVAYLHRTVFDMGKKYRYKISNIKKLNQDVIEIDFSPIKEKMNFLPGQFVFIKFVSPKNMDSVFYESHPFSISSASSDGRFSLTMKVFGKFTEKIYSSVGVGMEVLIQGPFGHFSYLKSKSKRQIWIAGGIGITPFLGMARDFDKNFRENNIDLYYATKNSKDAVFANELSEISKKKNNFKFFQHFSDENGYLSANVISKKSDNISDADIFICGPSGFMKSLREQFVGLGFKNEKIISEEFSL